jgi:hypothetical protein
MTHWNRPRYVRMLQALPAVAAAVVFWLANPDRVAATPAGHLWASGGSLKCDSICRYALVDGVPKVDFDLSYDKAYGQFAVDAAGALYVAEFTQVVMYPPNSSVVSLLASLPTTSNVNELGLAVDGKGNAYVLYVDPAWPVVQRVQGFPCGYAGVAVLSLTKQSYTGCFRVEYDFFSGVGLAFSAGELYIPNMFSVELYDGLPAAPRHAGSIFGPSFQYDGAMTVDSTGSLYVLNAGRYEGTKQYSYVASYGAGKTGNVAPIRSLSPPVIDTWQSTVAVDDTYLYVVDGRNRVVTYSKGANGRAAPLSVRTISAQPREIAVGP